MNRKSHSLVMGKVGKSQESVSRKIKTICRWSILENPSLLIAGINALCPFDGAGTEQQQPLV